MSPMKFNIPNNLDWELLKRFNICTHSSTFAEAAKKIKTSQGALNRQLDTLENELGKKLFLRTAKYRSMELTPDGKDLKNIVDQVFDIISKKITRKIPSTLNQERKKVLKIISTPGLSTTLLPNALSEYVHFNKEIRIELSAQVPPKKLDVGEVIIRNDFLPQNNLKFVKLCSLSMSFYASSSYLSTQGVPSSFEELTEHSILTTHYSNISSTDKYAISQKKSIIIEPLFQADYIDFLVEMAYRGHGILSLPDLHPATRNLIKIDSIPAQNEEIQAAFLDIAEQDSSIYKFINYLTTYLERNNHGN
ncbi:hypothetical protein IM40_10560 (plasmid) [Candidatus Paracaedimonas acanthamoebae]|nr:hypothetical protein IM40_10560 [Candidatus Paracaedimonas acanthamoebae]